MKTLIQLFVACLLSQAIFAQGDIWTQKANVGGTAKTVRTEAVGFSIGTKGYLGTGAVGNAGVNSKDFWEYDPVTNTWTQKADFGGTARSNAVGFNIGNKGYIGTGRSWDGTFHFYKDFWEYDPVTNTWTQKADFGGTAREGAVGFSIGSKGYLGTGADADYSNFYKDFWEYDPITDTWTQKADFGGGMRYFAVGFSIGTKGYLGTGRNNIYPYDQKDFWEYDPVTDQWTVKADFGGVGRPWATGFGTGTKGYIGTGYTYLGPSKDFWEYDAATDIWTQKSDFGGSARFKAVGFSIGSKGYLGTGGDFDIGERKDFWEYTPETNCTQPLNLSVPKISNTIVLLKWILPGNAVSTFNIKYRAIGTTTIIKRRVIGTNDHFVLKALLPNTAYEWGIRSNCINDTSAWVKGPGFTTSSAFASNDAISSGGNVIGKTSLQITPNPNKGTFNVQMQLPANTASTTIALYNNFGQLVWQQNLGNISGSVQRTIALENKLSAGLYTLTIQRSDIKLNQKMLINK